jgi:hypothetical protein
MPASVPYYQEAIKQLANALIPNLSKDRMKYMKERHAFINVNIKSNLDSDISETICSVRMIMK